MWVSQGYREKVSQIDVSKDERNERVVVNKERSRSTRDELLMRGKAKAGKQRKEKTVHSCSRSRRFCRSPSNRTLSQPWTTPEVKPDRRHRCIPQPIPTLVIRLADRQRPFLAFIVLLPHVMSCLRGLLSTSSTGEEEFWRTVGGGRIVRVVKGKSRAGRW